MDTFFYRFVQILCTLYFRIFHRSSTTGRQFIPSTGPLMIVTNHSSYLDPPLISAAFKNRRVAFMAKKELFDHFFLGLLIRNLAAFPVDRESDGDRQAFVKTIQILKEGGSVLVFPEGTRTTDGKLLDFQPGAARIALAVPGCQIIPARVRGSYEAYEGGRKIPRLSKISVSIGECLDLSALKEVSDKKQRAELITQQLRREIESL